ncbi:cytochrome P450 [Aspergillus spectabilis]
MPKLDSTLRESQRLNSFVVTATNRMVSAPGGVTTPSGLHAPRGTMLCAPAYGVLHDAVLYPHPEAFRPFRFAERRDALAAAAAAAETETVEGGTDEQGNGGGGYVARARQVWTTTSPEYPAFGHGRHACLGRFFASTLLKLVLAYVVDNYEIGEEVSLDIDERIGGEWRKREANF